MNAGAAWPQDASGTQAGKPATGIVSTQSGQPAADPNFILANAGSGDVQEAQRVPQGQRTPPPARPAPPAQAKPGASGNRTSPIRAQIEGEQITDLEESRRAHALNEAFLYKPRREQRAAIWDSMLRQPAPNPAPGSKIQAPLPADWQAYVRRINPSYVDHIEAAATWHPA